MHHRSTFNYYLVEGLKTYPLAHLLHHQAHVLLNRYRHQVLSSPGPPLMLGVGCCGDPLRGGSVLQSQRKCRRLYTGTVLLYFWNGSVSYHGHHLVWSTFFQGTSLVSLAESGRRGSGGPNYIVGRPLLKVI